MPAICKNFIGGLVFGELIIQLAHPQNFNPTITIFFVICEHFGP
jgi:hypothetical protein